MPNNNSSTTDTNVIDTLLPSNPSQSWSLREQSELAGTRNDLLEAAARQRRENPNYDPSEIVRELMPQPKQFQKPQPGDGDFWQYGHGIPSNAELEAYQAQEKQKEEIVNRDLPAARPVRLSDEAYENLQRRSDDFWRSAWTDVNNSQLTRQRAEYAISLMNEGDRFDVLASAERNVLKTIEMLRDSGLPDVPEVEKYSWDIGIPRDIVRDILPHAKDELEARAMATRIIDIYGNEDAARNSFVMNQLQNPDESYWFFNDVQARAKLESALMERHGDYFAALTDDSAIGRFIDQNLYRLKSGYLEIGRSNLTTAHGWISSGAELIGADSVHDWANRRNDKVSRHNPYPTLDTGNPKTDWILDRAFIDAPNLYSQIAPYAIFGPKLGGTVRTLGMMGASLSSMEQESVPLAPRIVFSAIDALGQRYVEQKYIYPRFERLGKAIGRIPAAGRPFGEFIVEGVKDSVKQAPDEFLQEAWDKISHDIAYIFTDGATWEGFNSRLSGGWEQPVEGSATATMASLFMMVPGMPKAFKAHRLYHHKINSIQKILDATKEDSQRKANPESFKQAVRPIVENALRYNQDAPAEVYITAERMDEIIPDIEERRQLLTAMGANEEYSRSRATGANMAIKISDYATAIAGHPLEAEFQKFIKVDLDGPTAVDQEQMEEVFSALKADADALLAQMQDLTAQSALPPELKLLRDDLRAFDSIRADEADRVAALRYASVKMAAAELGITPGEYIRTHNIRVKYDDQAATLEQLDAIIRESDEYFASLDAEQGTANDPAANDTMPTTEGLDDQQPDNSVVDSVAPADTTNARAKVLYEPSAPERALADVKAADLERLRLELGNLLMQGKHLSGEALAKYGLSAWHPQSVRMRMADMKKEADGWRSFQNNPSMVAQIQVELNTNAMPSQRTWYQDQPKKLEQIVHASEKIGQLFDEVLENPTANNAKWLDYIAIDEAEKQFLKAETGLDVDGFSAHAIDASAINHLINRHGEEGETRPDHLPITREDITLIPWVIKNPDKVEYSGKNDHGLDCIRYEKELDGTVILIEELRTGRKKLAVDSMRKIRSKPGDLKPTSETSPAPKAGAYNDAGLLQENDQQTNGSIPDANGDVKSPPTMQQSALVDADSEAWVSAAIDEVADAAGLTGEERRILADGATTILRASEDMPEAKALSESMGLVSPMQESETTGRNTKIIFPAEAGAPPLPARYVLVELDSLQPSHSFRNYTPNTAWTTAELAQQRNYDSGAMEATRQGIELERLNFDTLFNPATDAVNGPPIITQDGKILGGNNRSHRIYNRYTEDKYRDALAGYLQGEDNLSGIKPEALQAMEKPVLVRMVDSVDAADIPGMIGALNADFTTRRDPANLAANRGMRVGAKTMLAFAGINDQTVAAFLDNPDKTRKVLQAMVEEGALQQTDLPGLYDFANDKWLGDGRANGKSQIEQALFGAILPDSRLMDDMSESLKKKLIRALPALIRLKRTNSPELDSLIQAVAWHAEFQDFRQGAEAKGLKLSAQIELFRKPNQKNIFTGQAATERSGPAWNMFTELQQMKTQKEVAEYFTRKADELAGYSRGLFEQDASPGKDETRGDVTFYNRLALIRAFRGKADLSVFEHEMGHVILMEAQERVAAGMASESTVKALETLRTLAGGEFDRQGVEKVVRYMEAYLREGKAPSRELVDAFGTFRIWLSGVYEDIQGYLRGEAMNDEIRDAFDHLLATDADIREVREYYYATRDYLENLNVYKPTDRKKIKELRKKVEDEETNFQDRTKIGAFLRAIESREPIQAAAEAYIDALPVYKTVSDIIDAGGINLNEAIDLIGQDAVDAIRQRHGSVLFGGKVSVLDALAGGNGFESGHDLLDALAKAEPKSDAIKERVREIRAERVAAAQAWLKETESIPGDAAYHSGHRLELMAMQLEGLRQILNESQQKRIKALNLKALTDAAFTTVQGMLVRDIGQHRRYAMAEHRAGEKSLRAAKDGDYQAAYDNLQLQMFNHAIVTTMFRTLNAREKFRRDHTLKRMRKTLDNMHEDSREGLKQLLTRYGVTLKSSVKVAANGQRMREWVTPAEFIPITGMKELVLPEALRDNKEFGKGGALDGEADNLAHFRMNFREHIEPWIIRLERPGDFQNWRDLTVKQMEELRDAIDLFVTYGKGELSALRSERYHNIDEAIEGIVEEISKHGKEGSAIDDPDTRIGRAKNTLESFVLKGVTTDSIFAIAEGNRSLTDKGELQVYADKARAANAREENWMKSVVDTVLPAFKQLGGEAARIDKMIRQNGGTIDGLPFHESLRKARNKSYFTGEMLIAAIYNTGNADNLFQLQNAYGWNDEHIAVLRQLLTQEGWRSIETVWREMDKLYPDMDKIRFWATHKHSPKEPGVSFITATADGKTHESKGGYYPLKYDGLISRRQGAFQDLSNAKAMAQANMTYTSNKPASGFAIARARGADGRLVYKGPPLLALSPVMKHFKEVIHFVTHAQLVWELDRITGDQRFEKAFVERNGYEKYKRVRQWVNYLADFRQEQRGGPLMNWLHNRYITSVLGWNAYSASKQLLGVYAALSPMSDAVNSGENGTIVSLRYIGKAVYDYAMRGDLALQNELDMAIKDASPIMKARDEGGATQELHHALSNISPTGGDLRIGDITIPVKGFRDSLFKLIQMFDKMVANPLYIASCRMYLDGKVKDLSGMSEEAKRKGAIAFADSIAMTQSSPFRADHTPLQRGENIIEKFSAVCISGVMQPGNVLYQKMVGAFRGQVTPGQVASFIAKTYITTAYTEVLFGLLHGIATGDDDPWPEWYEWALAPIDNMLNWIPYVRNIVNVRRSPP